MSSSVVLLNPLVTVKVLDEIAVIFICSVPTSITLSNLNSLPSSTSIAVSEVSKASANKEVAFVVFAVAVS